MPEDSKKNQQNAKHGPKEQRKPRQNRQQAPIEKKVENKIEKQGQPSPVPKVSVPAKPPVYEDPGPEFYKSLKRETDEILKITEEANSKYKKKEIQSNWGKYEMPIKSYDEMEEEENLGADYEKLIQAPQSIGGHFQFKHEKSWDICTAPSLYDKYFEINMENLTTAISTIPFYERNNIDKSIFSESDLLTMNNRSVRYKQKYYNDKSYTTAELKAQDKIISIMKENFNEDEERDKKQEQKRGSVSESKDIVFENPTNISNLEGIETITKEESSGTVEKLDNTVNKKTVLIDKLQNEDILLPKAEAKVDKLLDEDDIDELIGNVDSLEEKVKLETRQVVVDIKNVKENLAEPIAKVAESSTSSDKEIPAATEKNPVIESPEDLEKWLDDFLDG